MSVFLLSILLLVVIRDIYKQFLSENSFKAFLVFNIWNSNYNNNNNKFKYTTNPLSQ